MPLFSIFVLKFYHDIKDGFLQIYWGFRYVLLTSQGSYVSWDQYGQIAYSGSDSLQLWSLIPLPYYRESLLFHRVAISWELYSWLRFQFSRFKALIYEHQVNPWVTVIFLAPTFLKSSYAFYFDIIINKSSSFLNKFA